MTPDALTATLRTLLLAGIRVPVFAWGAPGIGKSSIVQQVAGENGMDVVDVRLSQLAPTDLRGLPVADGESARWLPPDFLPRDGEGILFLDELNMAPPTMQGIAQQLLLDRRVGSYVLPDGWYVWAAGNRREDRAAVHQVPSPVANRMIHLEVEADFESWKGYALGRGVSEQVIAFLSFRPGLLMKLDPQRPAWPSPRSWCFASQLHEATLSIAPAVGSGAAAEFAGWLDIYDNLPDLVAVLEGNRKVRFPKELSVRYAVTVGLAMRAKDAAQALVGFAWLVDRADPEWVQLFVTDLVRRFQGEGKMGALAVAAAKDPRFQSFLVAYKKAVAA